jgi:putative phosphoribosyl transferase
VALYADRRDAGRQLGVALRNRLGGEAARLVLGLPRGGVIVAAEVASALSSPLDVLVVRKLGHPARPELGLGALAETGERVVNRALMRRLGVSDDVLDAVTIAEQAEVRRQVARYRGGRSPTEVSGREVVVVDDGLATGYTALAAAQSVRGRGAGRLVVSVPVGPPDSTTALTAVSDDVFCLARPLWLHAVGEAYDVFGHTDDVEVVTALARVRTE